MKSLAEHATEVFNEIGPKDKNLFLGDAGKDIKWNPNGYGGCMHLGLVNQMHRQAGTLIAPKVLIAAAHYVPPSNGGRHYTSFSPNDYGEAPLEPGDDPIRIPGDGIGYQIKETRRLQFSGGTRSDVLLCRLRFPAHFQGDPYPIAEMQHVRGLPVVVLDGEKKAFTGEMGVGTTNAFFSRLDERLIGGDSGHPVFITTKKDGQYRAVLLGCHYHTGGFQPAGFFKQQILDTCIEWDVEPPKFVKTLHDLGIDPDKPVEPPKQKCPTDAEVLAKYGLQLAGDSILATNVNIQFRKTTR